ncbi:cytochrome c [Ferruginibacter lapsinanis]|uniref:c-type cytochrome n=1 Tax=Ferruginibacter lapsinanis TaxID=563172 RepID=UPI001E4E92CA|nr:cytochrome c [Ferruginibacter lapsinanis]UEG51293.1 cytochrome c [Ferruginibacter lapsinanis]
MKNNILLLLIFFIVAIINSSCESKKEILMYGAKSCDSSDVRYTGPITNIINANCNSCHATGVANSLGGGVALDNYAGLSFWAANGVLFDNVSEASGANPMPKNAPKLSDCDIAKIRIWINNGYPNN